MASYIDRASGQPVQNLQEVELLITRIDTIKGSINTTTTGVTLRTGKQKTVVQIEIAILDQSVKSKPGQTPSQISVSEY